ncbi:16S rRNA methyltransferase [Candidatus Tenderia electrophaga]|uniref:Ribosomal RNA small subunit methyltransferase E n=1 Tax=Candidatus Tenderia electrophaga TaxID=1748243 RepID=A0A0S2THV0_9GAMM|nr:16S rRNA methyltransferase [Candidatus Tenderia electrophaga]
MRIPRIHTPAPLADGATIALDEDAFNHAVRVLRLKQGDSIILFNGSGGEYEAELIEVQKKHASASIGRFLDTTCESPLPIILGQCISRGEKMDYTIQKAVELGVHQIVPLFSERCGVKLNQQRQQKRLQHWHKVIISACEQCGRNRLPRLREAMRLDQWLEHLSSSLKLVLDPTAADSLAALDHPDGEVALLIGPEGGLTQAELDAAVNSGFTGLRLGPRILRTETAGVAALSVMQHRWGDLG